MNFENLECKKAVLYSNNGEQIMELSPLTSSIELNEQYECNKQYFPNFLQRSTSGSIEITNNINTEDLLGILGIGKIPDAYDVQFMKIVQKRKNKNRRINKKWLKKYGVKQVLVSGKGWEMCNYYTDGTFEFVKK